MTLECWKVPEKVKKWLVLLVGLILVEFGVAFVIRADLGAFPTTCLPYVISNVVGITMGQAVILFQSTLILGQILLLRKDYRIEKLIQIPVGIFAGYLLDVVLLIVRNVNPYGIIARWALLSAGIFISAIGVSLEVLAGVGTLATEGFVLAVCEVSHIRFGTIKVVFDVFLVCVAASISMLFLHSVIGIREGTLVSAIFLGLFSKFFMRLRYKKNHIKRAMAEKGEKET